MANIQCYRSVTNPNQHIFTTRRGSISVIRSGMVYTITVYPTELINRLGTLEECSPEGFNAVLDDATSLLVKILEAATNETYRTGNGIAALLTDAKRIVS